MGALHCSQERLGDCFDRALRFRNENRDIKRDAAYFDWRYLQRPCDVPAYVAWLRKGDRPLAAATVAPHDFCVRGRQVRLGIVGDISVCTSVRGEGVGTRLLSYVRNEMQSGVDDVIVLPNEEAAGPLRRVGWQTLGEIERRVRLLGAGNRSRAPKSLVRAALAMVSSFPERVMLSVDPKDWALRTPDASLDSIDRIWSAAPLLHLSLGRRDSAYVRWRFQMHPEIRYDIKEFCHRGEACGYVVSHQEGETRWIDDFLLSSSEYAAAFVAQIVATARRLNSCNALHVRQFGGMPAPPWYRLGFIRRSDTQAVMHGGTLSQDTGSDSSWYLTAGDKDV